MFFLNDLDILSFWFILTLFRSSLKVKVTAGICMLLVVDATLNDGFLVSLSVGLVKRSHGLIITKVEDWLVGEDLNWVIAICCLQCFDIVSWAAGRASDL